MQLVVSLIMYQTGICKKYQDAGDKINEANGFGISKGFCNLHYLIPPLTSNFSHAMLLLSIFIERLKEILLKYHDNIIEHEQILHRHVFAEADERIQTIFNQFQNLTS